MKWENKKIREFADVFDGPHATPKESNNGPVFLGIKNIKPEGGIDLSEIRHISDYEFESWTKRVTPKGNDIVLTYEATLHRYAIIPDNFIGCLGRRMALVRVNQDEVNYKFLYYTFLSDNWRKFIDSNKLIGATVDRISIKDFPDYQIHLPPLPTQRRIASILSAYDDLIENNLKRIKLLEEKAFLSYKLIVKSEKLGERKLNQVTQFLKRGISPKYVNDDGVVVLNQKCIRNHVVSFEESRQTDSEKGIPEERMLQKFDTLINSTGAGTLGRMAMNIQNEFPLTVDSHITIVRANQEITPIFLCMSLFASENVIEMMGEGATNQTELSPKKVGEEIKIPIVTNALMNEFEKETEPIFNLIWNLQKQNALLRQARDILLPRLMSGEIEIN